MTRKFVPNDWPTADDYTSDKDLIDTLLTGEALFPGSLREQLAFELEVIRGIVRTKYEREIISWCKANKKPVLHALLHYLHNLPRDAVK